MSKENLQNFCRLVLEDLELQNKLKGIFDLEEFFKAVLELGRNSAFEISRADLEMQIRENRRLWIERCI
jgi:hypothetical protein